MADKNQTNDDSPPSRKPGVVINRRVTPAADAKPASPLPQPGDPPALVRHKAKVAAAEAARAAAEAGLPPEPKPDAERIAPEDLRPYQTTMLNAELMKRSAETAQARAGEAAQAAQVAKLALFVKYKLGQTDTFDVKTGLVTRGGSPAMPASSPVAPVPAAT